MRKWIFSLLLVCSCAAVAQEKGGQRSTTRTGNAAMYGSRDATALSMMGWGLALGVGIATFCALVHNDSSHSH